MTGPRRAQGKVRYAIEPEQMTRRIGWYLQPVIDGIAVSRDSFAAGAAEVKAAHDSGMAGWTGGYGNGGVLPEAMAFIYEVQSQMQQLSTDQAQLVTSLEEYREALLGHIQWAVATDELAAERFKTIHRELDGGL